MMQMLALRLKNSLILLELHTANATLLFSRLSFELRKRHVLDHISRISYFHRAHLLLQLQKFLVVHALLNVGFGIVVALRLVSSSSVQLAVQLVVVKSELVVGPAEGVDFPRQVSPHSIKLLILISDGLDTLVDAFDLLLQFSPCGKLLVLESKVL